MSAVPRSKSGVVEISDMMVQYESAAAVGNYCYIDDMLLVLGTDQEIFVNIKQHRAVLVFSFISSK